MQQSVADESLLFGTAERRAELSGNDSMDIACCALFAILFARVFCLLSCCWSVCLRLLLSWRLMGRDTLPRLH